MAEITNIVRGAAAAADIVCTLKVHLYTTPRLFCTTTRCVPLPHCEDILICTYRIKPMSV